MTPTIFGVVKGRWICGEWINILEDLHYRMTSSLALGPKVASSKLGDNKHW